MAEAYEIETALNNQLNNYITAYPIDLAMPNVEYNPEVGTDYLKVDFLPGEPTQNGIGTCSQNRIFGVYQITINTKINQGKYNANIIYKQLKEFFARGTAINYDTIGVRITKIYLGGYLEESPWYRQVVNIQFRSDIDN